MLLTIGAERRHIISCDRMGHTGVASIQQNNEARVSTSNIEHGKLTLKNSGSHSDQGFSSLHLANDNHAEPLPQGLVASSTY
jgi:hypothetical protein